MTAQAPRRFRPTLIPTLMIVPMLITTFSMGIWQTQRLTWKEGVIAARTNALAADAVPLPPTDAIDPAELDYRMVTFTGTYVHDYPMLFLARDRATNEFGRLLVTPFDRGDGGPLLLVARGWVPDSFVEPNPPLEPVEITGLARAEYPRGWFTPDNDPVDNQWFWSEYDLIAQHIGSPVVPIVIDRRAPLSDRALPIPNQTRTDLPNNHLQYAITWFALTLIGGVIYFLYHWRREDEAP